MSGEPNRMLAYRRGKESGTDQHPRREHQTPQARLTFIAPIGSAHSLNFTSFPDERHALASLCFWAAQAALDAPTGDVYGPVCGKVVFERLTKNHGNIIGDFQIP